MLARKRAYNEKVFALIDYMNYNWEADDKFKEFRTSQRLKKGKKAEITNGGDKDEKIELETIKRAYYGS
jgi:hypothetical protein